jgi:hypothetical protein
VEITVTGVDGKESALSSLRSLPRQQPQKYVPDDRCLVLPRASDQCVCPLKPVRRPSFPNHHSPENQRSTPANLRVFRAKRARRAPGLQARCLDHRYYAVRVRQPFHSFYRPVRTGSLKPFGSYDHVGSDEIVTHELSLKRHGHSRHQRGNTASCRSRSQPAPALYGFTVSGTG